MLNLITNHKICNLLNCVLKVMPVSPKVLKMTQKFCQILFFLFFWTISTVSDRDKNDILTNTV